MVKNLITKYKLIHYLVFAIVLYLTRDTFFLLLCKISKINEQGVLHDIYYSLFITTLFIVYILVFGIHIISVIYKEKTAGRTFLYDKLTYKMKYNELVSHFKDTDFKINKDTLPIKKWTESEGLVFAKLDDRLLCYEHNANGRNGINCIVWGSPGDGKTSAVIIPTCRVFKGSVMCLDLKGDIYNANKDFRNIKRFSTIHYKESVHYDPLARIRNSTPAEQANYLENLAFTLIPTDNSTESKYFIDSARDYFVGISLYLLSKNSNIPFPSIIEEIVQANFSKWVIEIMNSDSIGKNYTNQFWGQNEKNCAGAYAQLVSSTRLYSSDVMKILLSNNDNDEIISYDDLENGTDIYIQVDPNQIQLYAPLVAMIYQNFMSSVLYRKEHQEPALAFILDEFGQIPALPVIMSSAALMRAFNCSLLFACQSMSMLEQKYGVAGRKLLMDCVKVNCFMSIYDPDTRDWASRLFGTKKVLKVSNSIQSKTNSSSRTIAETKEPIFEPNEFGILAEKDEVIIYKQGRYLKANKTYYFRD